MRPSGWEAAAASKAAAKRADPSRRRGLYPRRMECTVRSITACAVLNPEIRAGRGSSQPGCCGSFDTYWDFRDRFILFLLATPLPNGVNWYCREDKIQILQTQRKGKWSLLWLYGGEIHTIKLSVHISASFTGCPSGTTRHKVMMWPHSRVVSFSSHMSPSFRNILDCQK